MQSEFGPKTLGSSNPLLSKLWAEYPSTKMLNVRTKKCLNKKSSLKDFRLPQTFKNPLHFWLTTELLLFILYFVLFYKDKSVSFPTWKWVTILHGFNIESIYCR